MAIDHTCLLIGARAAAFAARQHSEIDPIKIAIMIECVHRETPLRLNDLLEADDFNFAHDVFGIIRHYSPVDGLQNCFRPRYCV